MKFFPLIWAELWRKPARTVFTALSVVSAFLLYGALNGTMVSFDKWIGQITGNITVLYTTSRVDASAGLPVGILPAIGRIPGVTAVDIQEGFNSYYRDPRNGVGVSAIDVRRRIEYPRPFFAVSNAALERLQRMKTAAIVGTALMKKYGWKVGERVPLTSSVVRKDGSNVWALDIVGTFDVTTPQLSADQVWMSYDYFDEARAIGHGTVQAVVSTVADPARAAGIAAQIDALFANSPNETLTRNMADMIRGEIDGITDITLIIDVILGAVFFTLLFVTGNTMMQSTVERIPELGVLKTCGYGDVAIDGLILAECTMLCVIPALLGIVIAATVLFPLIGAAFRIGALPMAASVVLTGIGIALALACAIALPPAWRLRRLSVIDALAAR